MLMPVADVGQAEEAEVSGLVRRQGHGVAEATQGLLRVPHHAPVVGSVKVGQPVLLPVLPVEKVIYIFLVFTHNFTQKSREKLDFEHVQLPTFIYRRCTYS